MQNAPTAQPLGAFCLPALAGVMGAVVKPGERVESSQRPTSDKVQ